MAILPTAIGNIAIYEDTMFADADGMVRHVKKQGIFRLQIYNAGLGKKSKAGIIGLLSKQVSKNANGNIC